MSLFCVCSTFNIIWGNLVSFYGTNDDCWLGRYPDSNKNGIGSVIVWSP